MVAIFQAFVLCFGAAALTAALMIRWQTEVCLWLVHYNNHAHLMVYMGMVNLLIVAAMYILSSRR